MITLDHVPVFTSLTGLHSDVPSSGDSPGRPRAEIAVIVGPLTAVVIGPIGFYLLDFRRADGDCRERTTTSR